ncbi:tetratricopeptide repeat protein [Oleidesulfovibrio sp.]|uniref:tetratricopeptide repeat protein n=1 Tax=Oleidesulfovibrio sp. TaxID=2909707 RepID=UPI003A880A5D
MKHRQHIAHCARVLAVVLVAALLLAGCDEKDERKELLSHARAAFAQKQYIEAERQYERYLQLYPHAENRWDVWNKLVEIARGVRGNPAAAAELLESMYLEFGLEPERAQAVLFDLATLYEELHKRDKALEIWLKYQTMPDLPPRDIAEAYRHAARIYRDRGEYDLALESLRACLDIQELPQAYHARCVYELAQTDIFMNNYGRAEDLLRKLEGMTEAESTVRALGMLALADVLQQQKRYAEAKKVLLSIKDTYPNPQVIEARLDMLKNKMAH